jgi:hypothetical protein
MSLHEFRPLIPSPFDGEENFTRFHHRDVSDLSPTKLWAELVTVEAELAHRIAMRSRLRILQTHPHFVSDRGWLLARAQALRAEVKRRGSARG